MDRGKDHGEGMGKGRSVLVWAPVEWVVDVMADTQAEAQEEALMGTLGNVLVVGILKVLQCGSRGSFSRGNLNVLSL